MIKVHIFAPAASVWIRPSPIKSAILLQRSRAAALGGPYMYTQTSRFSRRGRPVWRPANPAVTGDGPMRASRPTGDPVRSGLECRARRPHRVGNAAVFARPCRRGFHFWGRWGLRNGRWRRGRANTGLFPVTAGFAGRHTGRPLRGNGKVYV